MFSDIHLLQIIIDTIEEGVLVTDHDGKIVGFNKQVTDILSLNGDDALGIINGEIKCKYLSPSGETLPFEEYPSTITRTTGKPLKNQILGIQIPEKELKWVKVNTRILYHTELTYIFATFYDITTEHNLKHDIIKAKDRFMFALDGSGLGVWDFDVDSGEVFFSESAKEILGLRNPTFENAYESWERLIYPQDKDFVLKKISDYFSGQIPDVTIEYRLSNPDGSYKWIYSTGKIITRTDAGAPKRFMGTVKDITDQKRTQDILLTREQQLSQAFRYSAVGMALTSIKGNWIDVNPALCAMIGYTEEEMLGLSFQEITHPEDLPIDLDYVKKLLDKEIPSYSLEKRYFHKNGNVVWALLTVSLIWNKEGGPKFFIAQIVDVTNTKVLITELESKNSQLKLTTLNLKNKIEQLEEFNRIVAHNLRGPVGNIIQLGDMLAEDNTSADLYISMLKEASLSLDGTLRELIKILEIQLNSAIESHQCNFEEIVLKVKDMMNIQIQTNNILVKTDLKVAAITYPKLYLESILYNLVNNAIKYRRTSVTTLIKISTYLEQGKIVLAVEDNGLGIDLDKYGHQIFKLNKIFHKGFDSKGLGLFIAKNQIETLGGTISVDSKPNLGSTFKVTF
jgi:PAS domain S-box-containing protein